MGLDTQKTLMYLPKSLGMKLIQILTHQIGGEFNCFNENGAIVEIHFKQ